MALTQLDYSDCITFYDEVDVLIEEVLKREAHEGTTTYPYTDRISGKFTKILLYYLLSGTIIKHGSSTPYNEYELVACYNLYTLASETCRQAMGDLLGEWKASVHKAPDRVQNASPVIIPVDEMVG